MESIGSLLVASFLMTLLAAAPLSAQDPYLPANNDWITIDGTVRGVLPNSFTLDYGDGLITVEMDDGTETRMGKSWPRATKYR